MIATCLVTALVLAQPAQKIAVLEMQSEAGVDTTIARQLTSRLAEVVGARPEVEAISPDDVQLMLQHEAGKQLLGCDDQSCYAEIAGALGADMVVSGRIGKIEDTLTINLLAVDSRSAKSAGRVSQRWGGESIALLDLVKPMVDVLLGGDDVARGSVDVQGLVVGSRIMIDGEVRGTAPAGQLGNLEPGAHVLEVLAEGHQPLKQWFVVGVGATVNLAANQQPLPEDPIYTTWWFWTATAVGAAALTAGTVIIATGGDALGIGGSKTGVNVAVNADTFMGGER